MVEIKIHTHTVIKNSDIEKYLSDKQKTQLNKICNTINKGRRADGKAINSYIICNEDEPYANDVHNLIICGEMKK